MKISVRNISFLFLFLSQSASAGTAANSIAVQAPWVRETPPGMSASAGFMLLKNNSNQAHELTGAETVQADSAELHTHINDNGVMRMRPVEKIVIPANGEVALQPGGYHIMLMRLKQPLKAGEKMPIKLIFEDGSSQNIEAEIRNFQMQHSGHMMH